MQNAAVLFEAPPQLSRVGFYPQLVHVTGSLPSAILLSQILYWYTPDQQGRQKLRVFKRGEWWIAKSREEWLGETGLTLDQYKRAIALLVKKGFVATKGMMFNGLRITHLRLLAREWWSKLVQRVVQNPPTHWCKTRHSITETTTGITRSRARAAAPQEKDHAKEEGAFERDIQRGESSVGRGSDSLRDSRDICSDRFHRRGCRAPVTVKTIEDWVAERPGLAEQKLKVAYTSKEWLMKASEILAHHRGKKLAHEPLRLTANSLAMAWKRQCSQKYGGFVKDLTHKEMGQLKQFIQKVGDAAPAVMECALNDWPRFAFLAREQKGLKASPERPVVGFLLQYHDVAVQLIAKQQKKAEQYKMPILIDKKQEPQETTAKDEENATYDDVLKALQEFQK